MESQSRPPAASYDAFLLVSFGGPEKPDDVLPFLEDVTRGRDVPRARLLEVAEHYARLGGASPINEQNRRLLAAIRAELEAQGPPLPVYWGNRHWHPRLEETVRRMAEDGVRRALAFVTAGFGSYASCRRYQEAIEQAVAAAGPDAPRIERLRLFYNHPAFIEAVADHTRRALARVPSDRRSGAALVFTAHSVPQWMAESSDYEAQLREAATLVVEELGEARRWELAYQSRSGDPRIAWLEPDVGTSLDRIRRDGVTDVVVIPIGFVSDHVEVLYDLDIEAADRARALGLCYVRAETPGTHPAFARMVGELVRERT
ncbi:MAG TPA: ferrochelatase, partial [Candidatus Binatia bacterium]|nr:ferrochelatase [Candidatus Binatia bacterium]